jgi:hypothetical protein
MGEHVNVKAPDGSVLHEGVVLEIAADGALVLDSAGGTVSITLGDVNVIPTS